MILGSLDVSRTVVTLRFFRAGGPRWFEVRFIQLVLFLEGLLA